MRADMVYILSIYENKYKSKTIFMEKELEDAFKQLKDCVYSCSPSGINGNKVQEIKDLLKNLEEELKKLED